MSAPAGQTAVQVAPGGAGGSCAGTIAKAGHHLRWLVVWPFLYGDLYT